MPRISSIDPVTVRWRKAALRRFCTPRELLNSTVEGLDDYAGYGVQLPEDVIEEMRRHPHRAHYTAFLAHGPQIVDANCVGIPQAMTIKGVSRCVQGPLRCRCRRLSNFEMEHLLPGRLGSFYSHFGHHFPLASLAVGLVFQALLRRLSRRPQNGPNSPS